MYSQLFELQANFLKAIAHPRRLEIIQLLQDQELPVTDIHTMLDLPQANISQHLMILREGGVVETRKDGKQVFYKLSSPLINEACELVREVLIDQHQNTDVADGLLLKMKDLLPLSTDPVCKMRVSPKTAGFHERLDGKDYYFCASGCHKHFTANPEKYIYP